MEQSPLSARGKRPEVSRHLDEILRRATAPEPEDRYADGDELATALAALDAASSRRSLAGLALVGLLPVAALLFFALPTPAPDPAPPPPAPVTPPEPAEPPPKAAGPTAGFAETDLTRLSDVWGDFSAQGAPVLALTWDESGIRSGDATGLHTRDVATDASVDVTLEGGAIEHFAPVPRRDLTYAARGSELVAYDHRLSQQQIYPLRQAIVGLACGPEGMWVAVGRDGTKDSPPLEYFTQTNIVIYRATRSEALPGHAGAVTALASNGDGQFLASGGADTTVQLWEVHKRLLVHTFRGHSGHVRTVAFASGTVDRLVSGGDDLEIHLWDRRSGELVGTLSGHERPVLDLAVDRKGARLLSLGGTTVRLWDLADRVALDVVDLSSSGDVPRQVAWSPSGRSFVVGTARGVLLRFDLKRRR